MPEVEQTQSGLTEEELQERVAEVVMGFLEGGGEMLPALTILTNISLELQAHMVGKWVLEDLKRGEQAPAGEEPEEAEGDRG